MLVRALFSSPMVVSESVIDLYGNEDGETAPAGTRDYGTSPANKAAPAASSLASSTKPAATTASVSSTGPTLQPIPQYNSAPAQQSYSSYSQVGNPIQSFDSYQNTGQQIPTYTEPTPNESRGGYNNSNNGPPVGSYQVGGGGDRSVRPSDMKDEG